MWWLRSWIWLWVGAAAVSAQSELSPEVLLLARIKVRMEENLTRLPNYTCLQTIERSRRRAPTHRFELVDTLRIEVAIVGGKELFAWPGAGEFQEREISEIVQGGTIGNGNFGLHARSVFLSSAPTFTYVGEGIRDGRQTIRFDYRVPYFKSGYRIRVPPNEAIVGYHGSLWVHAETLDLVRLEVYADDIAPRVGVSEASDSIDYARVRIGDADFLLPQASELRMIDFAGNESLNRVQFSGCRQFTGQSFLSFGEAPVSDSPAPETKVSEIRLPAGLPINLKLQTVLNSEKSFVGDPVTAVVSRNVKKGRTVVVPKGALASGRITRLQKISEPYAHFLVGLQFYSLQFAQSRAVFSARLEDVGPVSNATGPSGQLLGRTYFPEAPRRRISVEHMLSNQPSGVGVFQVKGKRLQLPRGFRMSWTTEAAPSSERR
jgi:hypothetical protein